MRTFLAGFALCAVTLAAPALAGPSLHVTSAVVCEASSETCEGEGATRTFSGAGALRFVTTVEGATGEAWVEHVWKHDGHVVFRMKLPVRPHRYRTASRKTVSGLAGAWTATVVDPVGRELASVSFEVEEEGQSTH